MLRQARSRCLGPRREENSIACKLSSRVQRLHVSGHRTRRNRHRSLWSTLRPVLAYKGSVLFEATCDIRGSLDLHPCAPFSYVRTLGNISTRPLKHDLTKKSARKYITLLCSYFLDVYNVTFQKYLWSITYKFWTYPLKMQLNKQSSNGFLMIIFMYIYV